MSKKYEILLAAYDAGVIGSDSDIEDYCENNKLETGTAFRIIAEHKVKGTPCEGCAHVQLYGSGMYPCTKCLRQNASDHYQPAIAETKQEPKPENKTFFVNFQVEGTATVVVDAPDEDTAKLKARESFEKSTVGKYSGVLDIKAGTCMECNYEHIY